MKLLCAHFASCEGLSQLGLSSSRVDGPLATRNCRQLRLARTCAFGESSPYIAGMCACSCR